MNSFEIAFNKIIDDFIQRSKDSVFDNKIVGAKELREARGKVQAARVIKQEVTDLLRKYRDDE